jgi:hypothetical protein
LGRQRRSREPGDTTLFMEEGPGASHRALWRRLLADRDRAVARAATNVTLSRRPRAGDRRSSRRRTCATARKGAIAEPLCTLEKGEQRQTNQRGRPPATPAVLCDGGAWDRFCDRAGGSCRSQSSRLTSLSSPPAAWSAGPTWDKCRVSAMVNSIRGPGRAARRPTRISGTAATPPCGVREHQRHDRRQVPAGCG